MDDIIFTMYIHHGGQFKCCDGKTLYIDGEETIFDNCSSDKMSIPELESMVKEYKIIPWSKLHFLTPGMDLDRGLRLLWSDNDILDMLKLINSTRIIHIYVEHVDEIKVGGELDDEFDEDFLYEANVDEIEVECELEDRIEDEIDEEFLAKIREMNFVFEDGEEGCSDCGTNNHLHSPICSDDEEVTSIKYPQLNHDMLKGDKFELGNEFGTLTKVRKAVSDYSIKNGHDLTYVKNEEAKVIVKCHPGCPWKMYVSKKQGEKTFQIKTLYNTHTCSRKTTNKHATSKWIAQTYFDKFKSNFDWDWKGIVDEVRRDFSIIISRHKAYRAKKIAQKILEGTNKEQYAKLWDYCEEVRRSNPGSTCVLSVDRSQLDMEPVFRMMYMCLSACKKGFLNGCRPIICLDGCHLKGVTRGQLLSAVGIDGNDGIFPIAYALVDVESKESWVWFLEQLLDDIGPVEQHGWVFITDRQKGLVPAMEHVAPTAEHRFCVRHLHANMKKRFKGKLYSDSLWILAKATTQAAFEKEMKNLMMVDKAAHDWLRALPPKHWSVHAFKSHSKCDWLSNNLCESFNNYIMKARSKPIISMMESIRRSLMERVHKKRHFMEKSNNLITPAIQMKLRDSEMKSRNWCTLVSGEERFEVANGREQYVVDLNKHTCSCFSWEISGIPCPHAISSIWFMRRESENYVHRYFYRETFFGSYSFYIEPTNGMEMWPITSMDAILPPKFKSQPGRPKRLRRRDPNESRNPNKVSRKLLVMKCSGCNKEGHNIRSCRNHGKKTSRGRVSKLTIRRKNAPMDGSTFRRTPCSLAGTSSQL